MGMSKNLGTLVALYKSDSKIAITA